MQTFYINVPKANGTKKIDKAEIFIGFFTPGKENAIKREDLVKKCEDAGLINSSSSYENRDRAMRKLLERVKADYNVKITNDGRGEGYYIPTLKESVQLARNNKREDKRAITTFKNNKGNKALSEDFRCGRIERE